jgi:hypothetical protein
LAAAAVLIGLLAIAGLSESAIAHPAHAHAPTPGSGSQTTAAASPTAPTSGGVASAPDDTQQLGATDAECTHPAGLSVQAQRNCQASGSPQSAFPPSNYGLDTHVDTGLTDPGNDAASIFQHVLGWVFSLIAKLMSAIILAVSLAFGFDLYGSDHGQRIPHALQSAEQFFTLPWLPVAFAIGAIWGLLRWWGQRQEGRAVGHWALMVVMMLLGLVIVQDPQGVAGWLDQQSNQAAMASLAVFSGQHPSQPAGSYADATAGMWREAVEKPWCAEEFGEVNWCMSPPDPAMQKARTEVEAHLDQAAGDQAPAQLAQAQAPIERVRLSDAQTNGELWLAFPSNWDARNGKNDSWTLYAHLLKDQPALAAIRGSGGVGDRLGDLALAGIGMVFFVLLLIYIALNLLLAALFFVVLLLFAPLLALAPAFGERGREAFLRWLGWAAGALLAKLVYAIYLGVLLLGSGLVAAIGSAAGGSLDQWILFAAFWGLAFAYRSKLLGLFTADTHHEHHRGLEAAAAGLGALAITRGVGRRAIARPARALKDYGRDARDERRYLRDYQQREDEHRADIEAQRALGLDSDHQLQRRSVAMLDARHQHARDTLARRPEILERIAAARSDAEQLRTHRLAQGRDLPVGERERAAFERVTALEGGLISAERFLHGAQEHERLTGQRYTPRQLSESRAALEQELGSHSKHRDYEQLAYRLDGGRDAYREAGAEEKRLMREQIDRQIDEDRRALERTRRMPSRLKPQGPMMPPRPKRRRPHPYRQYGEFPGSRQHMPQLPRRAS